MKQKTNNGIDATDLALIEELAEDGRLSVSDLNRNLGISRTSVRRRLQKLQDNQIMKVSAVANLMAQGYGTLVMMGVNVRVGTADDVAERLAVYKNIRFVIIAGGRYDIIAWLHFGEYDQLHSFLSTELGRMPDIESIETMVSLRVAKASIWTPLDTIENAEAKVVMQESNK